MRPSFARQARRLNPLARTQKAGEGIPTRVIKAALAYHGAGFKGWQAQRERERTAQSVFEAALEAVTGAKISVAAASRTDAGVHAEGQVIHFALATRLPLWKLRNALNFHLPKDLVVRSVRFAPKGFHARFLAKQKVYRYRILNSPVKPVFGLDTGLWIPQPLDLAAMREAASDLIGTHDFRAFAAPADARVNSVRTLSQIHLKRSPGRVLEVTYRGDGFLQHMVRIITGTLIEIGRGKRPASEMAEILRSRDRHRAGVTARPHGLTLVGVYY